MSKVVAKALAAGEAFFKVVGSSYITRGPDGEKRTIPPGGTLALAEAVAAKFVSAGFLAKVQTAAERVEDAAAAAGETAKKVADAAASAAAKKADPDPSAPKDPAKT